MTVFRGTTGDDNLTGTSGNDEFWLWQGGNDTVHAGDGNDIMRMGNALTAADQLDGGTGRDAVILNGDYSAGLVLGASTITNVEVLGLVGGHSYNLTTNDGNVAAGQKLIVEANGLGAGDTLTFDGSAETDGRFYVVAGSGNDTITGGAQNDIFHLEQGGTDTVHGGNGNDAFYMGTSLGPDDRIDGGTGYDKVFASGFAGGDTITLNSTTMQGVEDFVLGGSSLGVTTNDATVAAGAAMIVDASAVNGFTFDGSAETDGRFYIIGGAGNDTLTGGARRDVFDLSQGGNDTAHGGGGNDTFNMGAAFDSGDRIDGGAGTDTLSLDGTYPSAITVAGAMVQNVETVTLAGSGYNIVWQSAIGSGLTVDASAIGSGNSVMFDSSALATGNVHLIAGAGDTEFHGGGGDDVVDLQNSTDGYGVTGGGGDDTVNFGANYGAGLPFIDTADGGAGSNTVTFDGDYSGGITLGPEVFFVFTFGLSNYQTVELLGDHSYTVTFDDTQVSGATLTGGAALTVDASTLGAGDNANLDFSLSAAPGFTVTGSAGDDTITFAANFSGSDAIDGGAGNNDTLKLNGDYSAGITLGASAMTNFETLVLGAGHDYNITFDDGNIAAGVEFFVDATALSGHTFTLDDAAETDGAMVVKAGAAFTAADSFIGGTAGAALLLDGDYSGGLVFGATTAGNLTDIELSGGHSYNLTLNAATPAVGASMAVAAAALGAGDTLTVDGSAVTDAHLNFYGGAGDDVITGGQDGDLIDLSHGGNDTVHGGSGANEFDVGAALTAADSIDGGGGTGDVIAMAGDYTGANALVMGAATVTRVAELLLGGGSSYDITTNDATVASGATLNVDASSLGAGDTLTFDGSAETNGAFHVAGGAGGDSFTGGDGADTFTGGGGADVIHYTAVAQSDSSGADRISDFDADADHFAFGQTVTGVDTINNATVNDLSASLGTAIDASMESGGAIVLNVTGGTFAGHILLVVDANHDATYDAGSDFVVDITGATHMADFSTSNFI